MTNNIKVQLREEGIPQNFLDVVCEFPIFDEVDEGYVSVVMEIIRQLHTNIGVIQSYDSEKQTGIPVCGNCAGNPDLPEEKRDFECEYGSDDETPSYYCCDEWELMKPEKTGKQK